MMKIPGQTVMGLTMDTDHGVDNVMKMKTTLSSRTGILVRCGKVSMDPGGCMHIDVIEGAKVGQL